MKRFLLGVVVYLGSFLGVSVSVILAGVSLLVALESTIIQSHYDVFLIVLGVFFFCVFSAFATVFTIVCITGNSDLDV